MAKVRRVIRCFQCGAILQCDDEKKKGFITEDLLSEKNIKEQRVLYCQNCYEAMKDINTGELNQNVDDQILKILDDAKASDAFIVYVIDLFSFNGTFKKPIIDKIKKLPIAVLATKRDLFPKYVKDETLINFVEERFEEVGIKPYSITIISAKEDGTYKELLERALVNRKGHDIYMIGDLTSGKTTILNRCMKHYENKTRKAIRVSEYPGTQTKVLQIPLNNSSFFFELPGLALDISVVGKVERDVQKIIIPKKEIKITSTYLRADESLVIGGLASYSLIKGETTLIKFYSAEGVESKKMAYDKVDQFLNINYNRRSLRPVSDNFAKFADFDIFEYTMENDNKYHDIAIEGLGWITFLAKGQTIQILLPKGCALKETLSKIGK